MGEIVEVQGGHIVRSTGRKDRHSKVCTAKGPRDRRVRLSAHTAIQFYDVQDRLGYDRPSKAVDWLIKKAKTAIDQLDQLPAWKPTAVSNVRQQRRGKNVAVASAGDEENEGNNNNADVGAGGESSTSATAREMYNADGSGLLPPSMDSDSIADTIKSFFPVGGTTQNAGEVTVADAMRSSVMQFQTYQPGLMSRGNTTNTSQTTQDLKLSLQSFQDPVGFQHQHQHQHQHRRQNPHHHNQHEETQQHQQHSMFDFSNSSAGGGGGWGETTQQQAEMGRYQRLVGWNFGNPAGVDSDRGIGASSGGGFVFVPPQQAQQQQQQPLLQQLFGHGIVQGIGPHNSNSSVESAATAVASSNSNSHPHLYYSQIQRGPLQSSTTTTSSSVRAWMGENFMDGKSGGSSHLHKDEHHHFHHYHRQAAASAAFVHPVSLSGIGYTSSGGGFSGFRIPARIQGGDEEQEDGNNPNNMSSSASPH